MEQAELFAVSPGRGDREELLRALPELRRRGATRLLLREKSIAADARRRLVQAVVPACREHGIEPWISEDVDLAIEVAAAGVHLSEKSPSPLAVRLRLPPALGIGVSLHRPVTRSDEELAACRHAFLGPLFATAGKGTTLGLVGFRELAARLHVPVFAIGGIGARELAELLAAGIRRIAAIRLFFDAADAPPR